MSFAPKAKFAVAVGSLLALTTSTAYAVTEVTVHPGSENCSAASAGCYVKGSYLYTCTTSYCGNWQVFK
jgi:hypothetical protein